MTRLENILQEFTKNGLPENERQQVLSSNDAPESFVKIAKEVLGGYFSVKGIDGEIKVIPTTVEFYYHEEQGEIKDYIVYHRNNKNEKMPKPLFKLGFLHNHVSGIDITCEHHAHGIDCRSSVLIRAFDVIEDDKVVKKNETRSTALYEYLFSKCDIFSGIALQWKDGEPVVLQTPYSVRKNVAMYNGEDKIHANQKQEGQKLTENKKHVQCTRLWQFSSK